MNRRVRSRSRFIAARAFRTFAQSSVTVIVAIYLTGPCRPWAWSSGALGHHGHSQPVHVLAGLVIIAVIAISDVLALYDRNHLTRLSFRRILGASVVARRSS